MGTPILYFGPNKHLDRTCKSVMSWSLHFGFELTNPFSKSDGTPLRTKSKHYVAGVPWGAKKKGAGTMRSRLLP